MLNFCHYPIPIYIYNGVVNLTHCQKKYHAASEFKTSYKKTKSKQAIMTYLGLSWSIRVKSCPYR